MNNRKEGQIILVDFPNTDFSEPKFRPALLIKEIPGTNYDWLMSFISTKLHHEVKDFDEILSEQDSDFTDSGLKKKSIIRLARLAVVDNSLLPGAIGRISPERLKRVQSRLADWLRS